MKAEYLNCVMAGVLDVIDQCFHVECKKGKPYAYHNEINLNHLSAVIRLAGDKRGARARHRQAACGGRARARNKNKRRPRRKPRGRRNPFAFAQNSRLCGASDCRHFLDEGSALCFGKCCKSHGGRHNIRG